jgi:hypothetical protein
VAANVLDQELDFLPGGKRRLRLVFGGERHDAAAELVDKLDKRLL